MSAAERTKRYIFFIIGLFVSSFGVAFITKANLGTSPISSIPYTLSLGFAPTIGQFTIYFSLLLVILQVFILRKSFRAELLLQIPVSIAFGYFIDWSMLILFWLDPHSYVFKIIALLIGCFILGVGVYMEMAADVVMLPGESFVNAISKTFNKDFGNTKIAFDTTMTLTAAAISLIMFRQLQGVREGTVIAAILVGTVAKLLKRRLWFVEKIFCDKKN